MWYDFPKLGNNHNLPYRNKMKQNFICMSLSNISPIHKEELESSGSARSVFPSGHVMVIPWTSEMLCSQPLSHGSSQFLPNDSWVLHSWWPPHRLSTAPALVPTLCGVTPRSPSGRSSHWKEVAPIQEPKPLDICLLWDYFTKANSLLNHWDVNTS